MAIPSPTRPHPAPTTPPPQRRGKFWRWLAAPLLGISLLLHGALLLVPLPSLGPPAEEAEEETPFTEVPEVMSLTALEELPPLEDSPAPPAEVTPDRSPPPSQAPPLAPIN